MIRKLLKFPYCGIIAFVVIMTLLLTCQETNAKDEPNWKWILLDVYWNKSGGQVCKFQRIGGREIRMIVRHRGYGCPNKSMNPYQEP